MKNKKKAFTLTELLVVVIVIGVLSAAVLPKFSKVIETRKTTEAEELMASIRTEQEKRCALDKPYLTDLSQMNDVIKTASTKNYQLTLQGKGVIASSKGNYSYNLQMPSYADGRICCYGADCAKLNKNYPSCTGFTYEESPDSCAGTIAPAEPDNPSNCTDCSCADYASAHACECNPSASTCCSSQDITQGKEFDPVTKTCTCEAAGKEWWNVLCVDACPAGQKHVTPTQCCPEESHWNGSECSCPTGQTWNGTACVGIKECSNVGHFEYETCNGCGQRVARVCNGQYKWETVENAPCSKTAEECNKTTCKASANYTTLPEGDAQGRANAAASALCQQDWKTRATPFKCPSNLTEPLSCVDMYLKEKGSNKGQFVSKTHICSSTSGYNTCTPVTLGWGEIARSWGLSSAGAMSTANQTPEKQCAAMAASERNKAGTYIIYQETHSNIGTAHTCTTCAIGYCTITSGTKYAFASVTCCPN